MKVKPNDYVRIAVLAGISDTDILRDLLIDATIHGIFIISVDEMEEFNEDVISYIEKKLLKIFNGSPLKIYKQKRGLKR